MKVISFFVILIITSCASQKKKTHIETVMDSGYEKYRQCYLESDSYQGRSAVPKGIIEVKLFVNADGSVKSADIHKSDFKDANFHACIQASLKKLSFGANPKGKTMEVIQQLNFLPVAP
jgi:hypothetical protein